MDKMMKKVDFLRQKRKAKGYTQPYVAANVGLSRGGYNNIEIGKRKPSVKIAKRLGELLGFDWTVLFEDI